MSFDLSSPKGFQSLESHLAAHTFVNGPFPTQADNSVLAQLFRKPSASEFPHVNRYYHSLASFTPMEKQRFPDFSSAGQKQPIQKQSVQAASSKRASSSVPAAGGEDLTAAIAQQAERVRELKAAKTDKATLQPEVDRLLALKAQAHVAPASAAVPTTPAPAAGGMGEADLIKAIEAQGNKVRELKAAKTDKAALKPEVDALIALKEQLKAAQAAGSAPAKAPEAKRPKTDAPADEGKSKSQLKKESKMKAKGEKKGKKTDGFAVTEVAVGTASSATFSPTSTMTTLDAIVEITSQAMNSAFPDAKGQGIIIRAQRKNLSYQVNTAMDINAKRDSLSNVPDGGPIDIAKTLIGAMPKWDAIEKAGFTPQGFIMIDLTQSYIKAFLATRVTKGVQPIADAHRKKVVVDFSSPNIAKEMHVGHLRSTIIGDTVCRMFEFKNHEVLRVNHIGDWGTQFGMLLCHLEDTVPDFLENPTTNIGDLTAFYKAAKKRFDVEDGFKQRSQERVVQLQAGEKGAILMWQTLCDISRMQFKQLYSRLDVRLTETGESFYNSRIPAAIEELDRLQLTKQSDGATCVFVREGVPPLIVKKRDGGYGYDSTDITAIRYRIFELKADKIIYITDVGQGEHFSLVFGAAAMAGWTKGKDVHHIGFGLVQDESGSKFKTRSGDTVSLVSLLDEAVTRMTATLNERIAENRCPLQPEEVAHAANVIGHASVKYFDLKQNPASNYIFSYDRMLDDKGDTAVYLLYTRARINSIIRRVETDHNISIESLKESAASTVDLTDPSEVALAFELMQFDDILAMTMDKLLPNTLCKYLYDLSGVYSTWNNKCKVLGAPEMKSRVLLSYATMVTMDRIFDLLGITPLDKI